MGAEEENISFHVWLREEPSTKVESLLSPTLSVLLFLPPSPAIILHTHTQIVFLCFVMTDAIPYGLQSKRSH